MKKPIKQSPPPPQGNRRNIPADTHPPQGFSNGTGADADTGQAG